MRKNLDSTYFFSAVIGKTVDFSRISLTKDQLSDFKKACLEESSKALCSNSEISELSEPDMNYYCKMFDGISDNDLKETVSALLEVGVTPQIIYDELVKLLPNAVNLKKLSADYSFILEEIKLPTFKKPTQDISNLINKLPNYDDNYNRKN